MEQIDFWASQLLGPRSVPLSYQELQELYLATDWGVVLRGPDAASAYGRFPAPAMFKALALPYLIHIESEAALARELEERDPLRVLCGFGRETPTRSMLRHFRHRPPGFYADVMLRVLIALVLSGEQPDFYLPFVRPALEDGRQLDGRYFVIRLNRYTPEIRVWTTPIEGGLRVMDTGGRTVSDLYTELRSAERFRRRRGLAGQLELPAEVATTLVDGQTIRFGLERPEWLKPGSGHRTRSRDTITTLGSAHSTSYAACNIIVLRQHEHGDQLLLTRSLDGIWRGEYVLPGGKAKPDESLEACTRRELFEETGLGLGRSRPISMHLVRLPGRPLVFSVGVLATEITGEVRRMEPQHNERWQWFQLHDLPAELSLPAQLALTEFRKGRLPDLDWSEVDIQWRRSAHRPVQLTLDSLLPSGTREIND